MNISLLQVYSSQSGPSDSQFHDGSDLTESGNDHLSNSETSDANLREMNILQSAADVAGSAVPSIETNTGDGAEKASQLVEERGMTDRTSLADAVVKEDPVLAVNGVLLDVQEPLIATTTQDPSAVSQAKERTSPLSAPHSGKSELPSQKPSQQPPRVTKKVTFAPEVAKHTDTSRHKRGGKVERHAVSHCL